MPINKATEISLHPTKNTSSILHVDALEKAVQPLLTAKQIHFISVDASGIVTTEVQQKFLSINYAATAFADMHIASRSHKHFCFM